MADKRKEADEPPSGDAVERSTADDAPMLENRKVSDISAVHPRARQQRVVRLLEQHRARADAGEIVGVVLVYVRRDGGWGFTQDLASTDKRAAIGELELVKHELVEQLLARSVPARDRRH